MLQTLLYFLSDIAAHKDVNQMPASNLAVCFAPSLFQIAAGQAKFKFRSALTRRHSIDVKVLKFKFIIIIIVLQYDVLYRRLKIVIMVIGINEVSQLRTMQGLSAPKFFAEYIP